MAERLIRFERLVGSTAIEILKDSKVLVFGLGGVGGNVCEALVRSGIGTIGIVDNDTVNLSNLNRQLIATVNSLDRYKTDVMEERLLSINPSCNIYKYQMFYLPENSQEIDFTDYDYVVDAIDTVTAKIDIIIKAQSLNVPIISSMGTGNRLDPSKVICTDIYKTSGDPLAKVMRRELKKRNVKKLKVVTSTELPTKPISFNSDDLRTPSSSPFVPPAAGLLIASIVTNDLIRLKK